MKKKLIIIHTRQFGHHTGASKFCEHLRDEFDIVFVCFDSGHRKLKIDGVKVHYVSHKGAKPLRGLRFLLIAIFHVATNNSICFVHYFEGCQYLKLIFPWKYMILDIRTLSVHKNKKMRTKCDKAIKRATMFFDHVTIISEGLRRKLNLNKKNTTLLPLGSDIISTTNKNFLNELKLLYIGTLNGRNIGETVQGLSVFINANPGLIKTTYDIVGDGTDLAKIKQLVVDNNLTGIVKTHGRISHFDAKTFFDCCNVGVSYVPITEYYEHQPVTKTFEYALSGMVCLATKTHENSRVINDDNGVLCYDNPDAFAKALEKIYKCRTSWNSERIRSTLHENNWKSIVKNKLRPILDK